MTHPTAGTCGECGVGMVSIYHWRRMTTDQRSVARSSGLKPKRRDSLCQTCGHRVDVRTREAAEGPATTVYRRAEVLEEWLLFVDYDRTMRDNCVSLAPRLGMRWRALEKALWRAGVRAWPVPHDSRAWGAGRLAS